MVSFFPHSVYSFYGIGRLIWTTPSFEKKKNNIFKSNNNHYQRETDKTNKMADVVMDISDDEDEK